MDSPQPPAINALQTGFPTEVRLNIYESLIKNFDLDSFFGLAALSRTNRFFYHEITGLNATPVFFWLGLLEHLKKRDVGLLAQFLGETDLRSILSVVPEQYKNDVFDVFKKMTLSLIKQPNVVFYREALESLMRGFEELNNSRDILERYDQIEQELISLSGSEIESLDQILAVKSCVIGLEAAKTKLSKEDRESRFYQLLDVIPPIFDDMDDAAEAFNEVASRAHLLDLEKTDGVECLTGLIEKARSFGFDSASLAIAMGGVACSLGILKKKEDFLFWFDRIKNDPHIDEQSRISYVEPGLLTALGTFNSEEPFDGDFDEAVRTRFDQLLDTMDGEGVEENFAAGLRGIKGVDASGENYRNLYYTNIKTRLLENIDETYTPNAICALGCGLKELQDDENIRDQFSDLLNLAKAISNSEAVNAEQGYVLCIEGIAKGLLGVKDENLAKELFDRLWDEGWKTADKISRYAPAKLAGVMSQALALGVIKDEEAAFKRYENILKKVFRISRLKISKEYPITIPEVAMGLRAIQNTDRYFDSFNYLHKKTLKIKDNDEKKKAWRGLLFGVAGVQNHELLLRSVVSLITGAQEIKLDNTMAFSLLFKLRSQSTSTSTTLPIRIARS